MLVKEIMTAGVQCISPDTTLQDAARKMRDLDVGSLPICGEDDRLAGIVTDRDIAVRGVAQSMSPRTARVREIMTPGIVFCFEDQDATEAARLMEEKKVRRLVVLNRQKRLIGILSLGDLATVTHDERLAGEALEALSEPVGAS